MAHQTSATMSAARSTSPSARLLFKAEQSLSSTLRAAKDAQSIANSISKTAHLEKTAGSQEIGGASAKELHSNGAKTASSTKSSKGALSSQKLSEKGGFSDALLEVDAAAEVRALSTLQANKVGGESTRKMAGVQAMLERKRVSHEETWAKYGQASSGLASECETAVGQAIATFNEATGKGDQEAEATLSPMVGDQLGTLSLDDIHGIWAAVSSRFPEREALIEQLGRQLEAVEQRRVAETRSQLVAATERLMDIAHLTRGPIERLVEEESLNLDQSVLANRQAHADLLRRLKTRELAQQDTWHKGWARDLERWRLVRFRHTLDGFCARMRSAEFADPPDRNEHLAAVRKEEECHVSELLSHVGSLRVLLPPAAFGQQAVDTWRQTLQASLDTWQAASAAHQEKLRLLGVSLDQKADAAYEELVASVKQYEAMPEEEAIAQLEREAKPLLGERREAARELEEGLVAFLKGQIARRGDAVQTLVEYVKDVAATYEGHVLNVRSLQTGIRDGVSSSTSAYNEENQKRVEDFEQCCARIGQGADDADLDGKVSAALQALARIEEGFRGFHADMTAKVLAYPQTIEAVSAEIRTNMEDLLKLNGEQLGTEVFAIQADKSEGIVIESSGESKRCSPEEALYEAVFVNKKPTKAENEQIEVPETVEAKETPPIESQPSKTSKPGSASKEKRTASDAKAPAKDAKNPWAEKGPGAKKGTVQKGTDASKAKAPETPVPTEIAASEEAAKAAGEGSTGEQEQKKSEPKGDTCPLAADGTPYFDNLLLPQDFLTSLLADLQRALSEDLTRLAAATRAEAAAFQKAQCEQLTSELDARLRKHRPRAGRVEEDMRSKRAAELLQQRHVFMRHVRAMSQRIKEDQAEFEESLKATSEHIEKSVQRLEDLEEALGDLQNLPGVQVKIREAAYAKRVVHGAIDKAVEELEVYARHVCEEFKSENQRFSEVAFKSFAEGGTWLPEAIADCERQLKAADVAADAAETQNFDRIADVRKTGEEALVDAHQSFTDMVGPHKEDLALLELAETAFNLTKGKVAAIFESSDAAAKEISDALAALSALLSDTEEQSSTNLRAVAKENKGSATKSNAIVKQEKVSNSKDEASEEPSVSGRAEEPRRQPPRLCTAALSKLDQLRRLIVPHAKFLQCLKSVIPVDDVSLDLDDVSGGSTAVSTSESKSTAGGTKKDAGKTSPAPAKKAGGKAEKKRQSVSKNSEAEEYDVSTLAGQVMKVISECRAKLADACKAYYEKLGSARAPTRRGRILEDAAAMAELHERTLAQLEWEAEEHRAAALAALREQILSLTGVLARLPASAFDDLAATEVAINAAARAQIDSAFAARLGTLSAQRATHRFALRPGNARPAMAAQFDELKEKEKQRGERALSEIADGSRAAVAVLDSDARAFGARLVRCTDILSQLYNALVLPEDLEQQENPVGDLPEGEEAAPVQRKSLKQLLLEQINGQQNADASSSGRPIAKRAWPAARAESLDLKELGWNDLEEGRNAEPPVEINADQRRVSEVKTDGRSASALGKGAKPPVKAKAEAETSKSKKGTERRESSKAPVSSAESSNALSRLVEGLDTPFHEAIVLARDSALARYSAYLAQAVAHYSQQRSALLTDETEWAKFWGRQCQECQASLQ